MIEIYTIYGGDMWRSALNGVVTILGTSSFRTLMKIAETFSVLTAVACFISKRNPMVFVSWAAIFMLITSVLLVPKRSVQIIDITNPAGVYEVDNVPVGLAAIAGLTTGVGYNTASLFDYTLARPDSLTYTKTGMLFGSQIIAESSDFQTQNPQVAQALSNYVESCVVGDMLLNHKYTTGDLLNSSDPLTLITSRPSPLRGMYVDTNDGQGYTFHPCTESAAYLKTAVGSDTQAGGNTWHYYANKIFGNAISADSLLSQQMGDSYSYFYAGGLSASQIMRNNVVNNAIRSGVKGFAAGSNDTANLTNLASSTAFTKQRLAWSAGQTIAVRTLPFMQSLLMLVLVCVFPLVIVLALLNHDTFGLKTLKLYVGGFLYFQMWPVMFAILNFAANFWLQSKTGTTPLVLSNLDQVALQHSDVQNMAGYLCLSIPVLSYYLTRGAASVGSQVASSVLGGAGETASRQASTSADGNWSFDNMAMDNVSANKFDTNMMHRSGQMAQQTTNGAMVTQTQDGHAVYDTSGAISNLPVNLRLGQLASSGFQQQARQAETQAQTAMEGYNHSVTSSWNQLSQMQSQSGNSDSMVHGSDNSQAVNATKGASMMMSAAKSYAASNHISEQEAYSKLSDIANNGSTSVGGSVDASVRSDRTALGKVASLAVGAEVGGEIHARGDLTHITGSSRSTKEDHSAGSDHKRDETSQEARDFKQGMDMVMSSRVSDSGSHTDNSANSHVEQLAASLSDAKNQYQQYTDSTTRSHELSEAATRTQSMSASLDTNYNQEFADYVTERNGAQAQEILTHAPLAEQAATQFVQERLEPLITGDFANGRSQVGSGMPELSHSPTIPASEQSKPLSFKEHGGRQGNTATSSGDGLTGHQDRAGTVTPESTESTVQTHGGATSSESSQQVENRHIHRENAMHGNAESARRGQPVSGSVNTSSAAGEKSVSSPGHVQPSDTLQSGKMNNDYETHQQEIAAHSSQAGIAGNVAGEVAAQRSANQQTIDNKTGDIEKNKTTVQTSSDKLREEDNVVHHQFKVGSKEAQIDQTQSPISRSKMEADLARLRNQG
jgi:conjugal transfer mating pair stabilization protein TraG